MEIIKRNERIARALNSIKIRFLPSREPEPKTDIAEDPEKSIFVPSVKSDAFGRVSTFSLDGYATRQKSWEILPHEKISNQELETSYTSSALARLICEKPVDDALRTGVKWEADDPEISEFVASEFLRLSLEPHILEMGYFARVFGGSVLIPKYGTEANTFSNEGPLEKSIFQKIERYTSSHPDYIQPYINPGKSSPGGKGVQMWNVRDVVNYVTPSKAFTRESEHKEVAGSTRYHNSRVIRCIGNVLSNSRTVQYFGFGQSILEPLVSSIAAVEEAEKSLSQVINAFQSFVLQCDLGLLSSVKSEENLRKHVRNVKDSMEAGSVIAINSTDSLTSLQQSVSGYVELIEKAITYLSAKARIPRSILFSNEAGGLASSGGGYDIVNYHQDLRSSQAKTYHHVFVKLKDQILLQRGIRPGEVKCNPVFGPIVEDSAEKPKLLKERVESLEKLYSMGVLSSLDIAQDLERNQEALGAPKIDIKRLEDDQNELDETGSTEELGELFKPQRQTGTEESAPLSQGNKTS